MPTVSWAAICSKRNSPGTALYQAAARTWPPPSSRGMMLVTSSSFLPGLRVRSSSHAVGVRPRSCQYGWNATAADGRHRRRRSSLWPDVLGGVSDESGSGESCGPS